MGSHKIKLLIIGKAMFQKFQQAPEYGNSKKTWMTEDLSEINLSDSS